MNKIMIFSAVLMVSVAAFITMMATKMSAETDNRLLTVNTSGAQLLDASGKALDFSTFKGKMVFVNNWASWVSATFILDKSGAVISEHVGIADYSNDELSEELKALANE